MCLIKSLSLACIAFMASNAYAIDQIYNWNGLEFVRSGNAHHVHPASPESTRLRGGWLLEISDVEPKATATHPVPYKNQSNALVTVKPSIDPNKVSISAASKIKDAAKAAGPNPYLAVASIGCAVFCDALIDWGVDQLKNNGDDSFSVVSPDGTAEINYSDGYEYSRSGATQWFPSAQVACSNWSSIYAGTNGVSRNTSVSGLNCYFQYQSNGNTTWANVTAPLSRRINPSCLIGSQIVNGVCNIEVPTVEIPLETYLNSSYVGKGWDNHWAKMTAAIVASGGNVFTDGTSTDITGPSIIPVSVSETKTSVSLVPGTTNPAPSGHTGPTDSGTQTTTTSISAHNRFNPAPLQSGTAGSPASGPSMQTTQTTTTTTSITNNVTNITNIVNETTTEKDEAPDEPPTDTPFGELPELYKQKYPDGLMGVMRTQMTAMKATPLFSLPMQMMGDLPQTGQCPSWQIDLSIAQWASFGTYNIGADCAIWDFAGWVVVISAFLLARQLVFGG